MKTRLCLKATLPQAFCAVILMIPMILMTQASRAQEKGDLNAQLQLLMQWWPGHYDNHEQITRQSGGGLSDETSTPFFRTHAVVDLVRLPTLGENVLYIHGYRNKDPAQLLAAELYALSIDEKEHGIRIARFVRASTKLDRDAIPETLKAADFIAAGSRCDVVLHYVGGQFEGDVQPKLCALGSEYLEKNIVVGPRYFWTRERRRDLRSDRVTQEAAPGTSYGWFEQVKTTLVTCLVFQNAAGDMKNTKYLTTVKVYDQGGEQDIAWPDGRTLTFKMQQRAFTSPPDHEYPLFGIYPKGNPVPIAYAWGVDGTKRFGINLGWFYTRCYAEGEVNPAEDRVRESQK